MNNIEVQNQVIIGLLAAQVLGAENVARIVTSAKKKGKPSNYLRAYNALDGETTGVALAKIVGVSQQAISKVLQTWEEKGIAYRLGANYVGLLKLPTVESEKSLRPQQGGKNQIRKGG